MNYTFEVAGIPRYEDAYLPQTVKKSAAIEKMQAKFAQHVANASPKRKDPPPRKVFKAPKEIAELSKVPLPITKTPSTGPSLLLKKIPEPKPLPQQPQREPEAKDENSAKSNIPESPTTGKPKKKVVMKSYKRGMGMKNKAALKKRVGFSDDERTTPRGWEFGKKKHFVRHESTPRNNKAAIQIQRMAKGWIQRLHFKVQKMQWLLDTRQQRTNSEIAKIRDDLQAKKDAFDKEIAEEETKAFRKLDQSKKCVNESSKIISYLRKENKKLREKNDEIFEACRNLKAQNGRLEEANKATEENIEILRKHTDHIEETHRKLNDIIPRYRENIDTLTEALETREAYCLAEHKIKVMYTRLMGDVVDKVAGYKNKNDNGDLEESIMYHCLEMEGKEHDVPLPSHLEAKLPKKNFSDGSSSSLSDDDDSISCDLGNSLSSLRYGF